MSRVALERVPRWPAWPRAALIAGAAWAALVAAALGLELLAGIRVETCLFRRLTGLPCPGCGLTRALLALLEGHPLRALGYNPLGVSLLALGVALLGLRLASGRAPRLALSRAARRGLALGLGAALIGNWIYLLVALG